MKDIKEKKPHENGIYEIRYGDIFNKYTDMPIENPAIIIDMETGAVIKCGSLSKIEKYYENFIERTSKIMPGEEQNIVLFNFDHITGFEHYDKHTNAKFTNDEICTLINILNNCLGIERIKRLLYELNEQQLHDELKRLRDIGW